VQFWHRRCLALDVWAGRSPCRAWAVGLPVAGPASRRHVLDWSVACASWTGRSLPTWAVRRSLGRLCRPRLLSPRTWAELGWC